MNKVYHTKKIIKKCYKKKYIYDLVNKLNNKLNVLLLINKSMPKKDFIKNENIENTLYTHKKILSCFIKNTNFYKIKGSTFLITYNFNFFTNHYLKIYKTTKRKLPFLGNFFQNYFYKFKNNSSYNVSKFFKIKQFIQYKLTIIYYIQFILFINKFKIHKSSKC